MILLFDDGYQFAGGSLAGNDWMPHSCTMSCSFEIARSAGRGQAQTFSPLPSLDPEVRPDGWASCNGSGATRRAVPTLRIMSLHLLARIVDSCPRPRRVGGCQCRACPASVQSRLGIYQGALRSDAWHCPGPANYDWTRCSGSAIEVKLPHSQMSLPARPSTGTGRNRWPSARRRRISSSLSRLIDIRVAPWRRQHLSA